MNHVVKGALSLDIISKSPYLFVNIAKVFIISTFNHLRLQSWNIRIKASSLIEAERALSSMFVAQTNEHRIQFVSWFSTVPEVVLLDDTTCIWGHIRAFTKEPTSKTGLVFWYVIAIFTSEGIMLNLSYNRFLNQWNPVLVVFILSDISTFWVTISSFFNVNDTNMASAFIEVVLLYRCCHRICGRDASGSI